MARINLYKLHPDSLKPVHMLPAIFTLGCAALLLSAFICLVCAILMPSSTAALLCAASLVPLLLFSLLILVDSWQANASFRVGALSIKAAFYQLSGYGSGFLRAWWLRCVLGRKDTVQAYNHTFYK